jgi:hypothetical protein
MNKQTIDGQETTQNEAKQKLIDLLVDGPAGNVSESRISLAETTDEIDEFLNEENRKLTETK